MTIVETLILIGIVIGVIIVTGFLIFVVAGSLQRSKRKKSMPKNARDHSDFAETIRSDYIPNKNPFT